jgi:very-short-patch-repair endonuclease
MRIPGIVHREQLRAQGVSRKDLLRWARKGAVLSLQPWYVNDQAPRELVELLRLGVRPTCLDAASLHGLWIPPHEGTHVFRPRTLRLPPELTGRRATPIRRRDGRVVPAGSPQPLALHGPELRAWPDCDPVPDLPLVLQHAGRCLPVVKAAVLMESALQRRLIGRHAMDQIISSLPRDARRGLQRIRSDAESGTETVVRWWFEARRIEIRSQVRFPDGRRRMDLLVGRSWVIECDSREFHDDPLRYAEDRQRDLYLAAHGYRVTRLTWAQVFLRWPETEARLLAILAQGDYRRPPRPGSGARAV